MVTSVLVLEAMRPTSAVRMFNRKLKCGTASRRLQRHLVAMTATLGSPSFARVGKRNYGKLKVCVREPNSPLRTAPHNHITEKLLCLCLTIQRGFQRLQIVLILRQKGLLKL